MSQINFHDMKKINLAVRATILASQGFSILLYMAGMYLAIVILSIFFTGDAPYKTTYGFYTSMDKVEEGVIDWDGQQIKVEYEYKNQLIKIPADKVGAPLALSNYLLGLLGFSIFIYITRLFLKFLRSVESDEVFTFLNIKRLQKIAYTLIIYSVFLPLYRMIMTYIIMPPRFHFSWEFNYLFFGIFLLVITEVLKAGLNIKSENELTI